MSALWPAKYTGKDFLIGLETPSLGLPDQSQSEASIQVTRDLCRPIRGQDGSQPSTLPELTSPVKMTKIDIKESEGGGPTSSRPIRGPLPGHVTCHDQSEASKRAKSPSPARREAGIPAAKEASPQTSPPKDMSALWENNSSSSRLAGQTVPLCSDKNREGVSNESGYFEDEDAVQREDSIEIIFDKNASNNNSGQSAGQSGRKLFSYNQP